MTQKAPRFSVGERLSASKQNRVSDAINQLAGPFNLGPSPAQRLLAGQMLVLEVSAINHVDRRLTCIAPGSTVGTAATYTVYMPKLFSETTRNGATYTYPTDNINARTQTAPISESQEITPNIIVGDEVYAVVIGFRENLEWFPGGRMWASV